MDFTSILNKSNPHQRTIIHLDMDYFYAQVEEIRDPKLKSCPLGIQQKNIVVTCNYLARQYGVTKLMSVEDAKQKCANLVLVKGEDLTPYRQMSQRIFELLTTFTNMVEKLGFDENFLDVTALVAAREQQLQLRDSACDNIEMPIVVGHIYPADGATLNACDCGCAQHLATGTQIAKEIRAALKSQLGMTCCAGISYNKLLAKLVGSQNKPNEQTVLVSSHAEQFLRELRDLNRITGIGQKTESLLLESGIANVNELQHCDMDFLRKKFGFETATKLKDLSFGRDTSAVRPTGKPKTIGLEDSCRPISVRTEVEERFRLLLMRLVEQVAEDGRIPIAIKVILRKVDAQKKTSHRETKQANILPSLFKSTPCTDTGGAKVMLSDGAQEKLLKIVMRLFERVVDLSKPFNITLIGLAFSKFQQRKVGSSSIANFLIKKTDLEVQSITSLTNTGNESPTPSVSSTNSDEAFRSSPTTFQPSDQFYRRHTNAASPIPMLIDNGSDATTNSDWSDFSETEVEPSPKKSRFGRMFMAKRHCSAAIDNGDATDVVASPSKLRVCDLRLNSRDSEKEYSISSSISSTTVTSATPTVQRFRTIQPPSTLFSRTDGRRLRILPARQLSTSSSSLPSPMDESGTPTTPIASAITDSNIKLPEVETLPNSTTAITTVASLSNIPCPAGVDPEVFNELPIDVQNELIASWRSSLAAAALANGNVLAGGTPNGAQKNTLYRYFLRNK